MEIDHPTIRHVGDFANGNEGDYIHKVRARRTRDDMKPSTRFHQNDQMPAFLENFMRDPPVSNPLVEVW